MSDERDLTPEQEGRVTRLLAEARQDGPIPPEVAARLDRVLERMADERVPSTGDAPPPVVDIAARRRRRAMSLLAAAAAVVVVGIGVGQVVEPRGGEDQATSGGGRAASDEDSLLEQAEEAAPGAARTLSPRELERLGEPPRITPKSFARQVRRLQDRPGVRSVAPGGAMMDGSQLTARGTDFPCSAAKYGEGKLIAVHYNGRPAVLAYRPPSGETQVVELLQCGSGLAIRSTTVPLP